MLMSEAIGQAINILNAAAGPTGGKWLAEITPRETLRISHDLSGWEYVFDDFWRLPHILAGTGPRWPAHPDFDSVPVWKPTSLAQDFARSVRVHTESRQALRTSIKDLLKIRICDLAVGTALIANPISPLQIWPIRRMIVVGTFFAEINRTDTVLAIDVETGTLEQFTQVDFDNVRVFVTEGMGTMEYLEPFLMSYARIFQIAASEWQKRPDVMAIGVCG